MNYLRMKISIFTLFNINLKCASDLTICSAYSVINRLPFAIYLKSSQK